MSQSEHVRLSLSGSRLPHGVVGRALGPPLDGVAGVQVGAATRLGDITGADVERRALQTTLSRPSSPIVVRTVR
jgi:hypothetical protein